MRVRTPRPAARCGPWLLALALLLATPAGAAAVVDEPPLSVDAAELDAALECPEPLADLSRDPVLLVHGTGPSPHESFGWSLQPQLAADGLVACTVALPARGLGDIQVAAEHVVHAVRELAADSGRRVDVIAHSQGGLTARWALAFWPSLRERVGDLVTLAAPHRGTRAAEVACEDGGCPPAAHQMRPGSALLAALDDDEELAGVAVTSLGSRTDGLVQPPSSIELDGAASIAVQEVCPGREVSHSGLLADAVAYALLRDALAHEGPADPARLDADVCGASTIPELDPGALLSAGSLLDLLAGTLLDPEVSAALQVAEEPAVRAYAGGHALPPPALGEADGAGDRQQGAGAQQGPADPGGASADGTADPDGASAGGTGDEPVGASDAAGTSSDRVGAVPAAAAAVLGAALVALAVLARRRGRARRR